MVLRLQRAVAYIVTLALAIYLYDLAEHFAFEPVPGRVGPDAWPKIVLLLMIAASLWQIVRIVLFGAVVASRDEVAEDAPIAPIEGFNFVHLAWLGIATTVVYALLMPLIGFYAATVIFIAAVATLAGRFRRVLPLVATSFVAPFVLMFIFMRVVYIALPLGQGVFKDLSLALLKILSVR